MVQVRLAQALVEELEFKHPTSVVLLVLMLLVLVELLESMLRALEESQAFINLTSVALVSTALAMEDSLAFNNRTMAVLVLPLLVA